MNNITSLTYSVGNKTFGVPRCFVFISQYASICGPIVERYLFPRADSLLDCNDIKTLNGFVDQNICIHLSVSKYSFIISCLGVTRN